MGCRGGMEGLKDGKDTLWAGAHITFHDGGRRGTLVPVFFKTWKVVQEAADSREPSERWTDGNCVHAVY